MAATFVYNHNLMVILNGISLVEKLFNTKLDYGRMKVFGCRSQPCLHAYRKNKLDRKSSPHIFLGYQASNSGYILLNSESRRVIISRDVFVENDFSLNIALAEDQDQDSSHDYSHRLASYILVVLLRKKTDSVPVLIDLGSASPTRISDRSKI